MDTIIKKYCLGIFLLTYSALSNGAILIINNGTLMGATGVNVNGVLYDVQFLDGSCDNLFNGCDELTDFTFSNPSNDPALLRTAMFALFEQVLIDSPLGNFDSNPALTNGCNVSDAWCQINTPLYPSNSTLLVPVLGAVNTTAIDQGRVQFLDRVYIGSGTNNSAPLSPDARDYYTFAVWNQTTVVPVPSAIWLFGSGLLALIGLGRNRNKNA